MSQEFSVSPAGLTLVKQLFFKRIAKMALIMLPFLLLLLLVAQPRSASGGISAKLPVMLGSLLFTASLTTTIVWFSARRFNAFSAISYRLTPDELEQVVNGKTGKSLPLTSVRLIWQLPYGAIISRKTTNPMQNLPQGQAADPTHSQAPDFILVTRATERYSELIGLLERAAPEALHAPSA